MKKWHLFLKFFLYFIIVLLGLTIVTPEWLDLKDSIFTTQQTVFLDYKDSVSYQALQALKAIENLPYRLLLALHYQIAGASAGKAPEGFGAILFFPFWLLWVIALYLGFLFLNLFHFFLFRYLVKRSIQYDFIALFLYQTYPVSVHFLIFIITFSVSLLMWSFF